MKMCRLKLRRASCDEWRCWGATVCHRGLAKLFEVPPQRVASEIDLVFTDKYQPEAILMKLSQGVAPSVDIPPQGLRLPYGKNHGGNRMAIYLSLYLTILSVLERWRGGYPYDRTFFVRLEY